MKEKQDVQEYQYDMQEEGFYKRMTLIPVDWDEDKKLHHFLLAFEIIRKGADNQTGAREQLQVYYEQLKQSIIENDSYVDALLELSDLYGQSKDRYSGEKYYSKGKRAKEQRAVS